MNLSKFYYEYGSLILLKLENSTDIFGALIQTKKEENEEEEIS